MKKSSRIPTLAAACFSVFHLSASAAEDSIYEFDREEVKAAGWRVVDDGVMGGRSKGNLQISDEGVLTFEGTLSLENNGGFSSLRTDSLKKDLSGAEGLVARVKGDGRTYQLRIGTDARFRGMEISFMAELVTEKDKWIEVKVPFKKLSGSFRGMKLKDEVFDPAKVSRIGLLLGDKKTGPFKLQVDWIRAYGVASGASDVVATALADGRFGTLATALTEAKLVEVLQGEGPFTVFAPTDKAFSALPKGTVESLLKPENQDQLQAVLKYHVLAGKVELAGALAAKEAKTVQGELVKIGFSEGKVRVNDAAIIEADVLCSNGVIHVIDSVILPPKPANDIASVAKRAGSFKTLLAAINAAGLDDVLSGNGPLTVFAPTDDAFKALPKGTVEDLLKPENQEKLRDILALHAVSGKISAGDALNAKSAKALNGGSLEFTIEGGMFRVNGVTILKTDIECDNGVIHVIDAVLLPSKPEAKKQSAGATASSPVGLIESAIDRGVSIFNSGDHGKCAEIYRACMVSLSENDQLDPKVGKVVRMLVERANKVESDTDRAWLLREGLDQLYALLAKN